METSHEYICPPLGLNRLQSASHIGVGTTKFDEMVDDGRMPKPRKIDARSVWDRIEVEMAFRELPKENQQTDEDEYNEWDDG
jgi:predicted DNA-binding transcriptional regulator AlpA